VLQNLDRAFEAQVGQRLGSKPGTKCNLMDRSPPHQVSRAAKFSIMIDL
jgi:hypothetical protein